MKRYARILLLLTALLGLCACEREMEEPPLHVGGVLLQVRGEIVLALSPDEGQLGFSADRKEFRAGTDDMSEFFVISCSELPVEEGQHLTADIRWTSHNGIQRRGRVSMKVQQIQGGSIWLWSSRDRIAAVVKDLR